MPMVDSHFHPLPRATKVTPVACFGAKGLTFFSRHECHLLGVKFTLLCRVKEATRLVLVLAVAAAVPLGVESCESHRLCREHENEKKNAVRSVFPQIAYVRITRT